MITLSKSLNSLTKVFLIISFIVLITACSFKSLYNQLDYLIPAYLEGMVSLDHVLEKKVEQRSQTLINWHRNTQLKEYADWLRILQRDVNPQLTEAQFLQHIATLELFWQALKQKINEEMAALLPLLNRKQRRELFSSITDNNQDFRDDYINIDEKERIDLNTRRMLENYENWLGEQTAEQEQVIKLAASQLRSAARLRLQQREIWQVGIKAILDSGDTATFKSKRLREFFNAFEIKGNTEIKRIDEENIRIFAQLTVQIVRSFTHAQKEYFINKTNDYIRMFTELAENR